MIGYSPLGIFAEDPIFDATALSLGGRLTVYEAAVGDLVSEFFGT